MMQSLFQLTAYSTKQSSYIEECATKKFKEFKYPFLNKVRSKKKSLLCGFISFMQLQKPIATYITRKNLIFFSTKQTERQ